MTLVLAPELVLAENTSDLAREDWLALRMQGLGGSDAAAAAGLDPWRTPLEVWHEKRGELPDGYGFEGNERADWGHKLEPVIAAEFTERTGLEVVDANMMVRHPEHPFMLANPDRLVLDPTCPEGVAGLEIKTTSIYQEDEWNDGAPFRALIQSNHYAEVLGLSRWYIAVLIGGQEFRHIQINRDPELAASLVEIETEFWNGVLDGTPPPIHANDSSLLAKKWYAQEGKKVQVDRDHVMELLTRRERLKQAAKDIETETDQLENELKWMLADGEIGCHNEWPLFTWKAHNRTDLDTKRLRAELPRFAATYSTTSSVRKFGVPKIVTEKIRKAMKEEADAESE